MRPIVSSVLVALFPTSAAAQSYGTVESKRKVEVVGPDNRVRRAGN